MGKVLPAAPQRRQKPVASDQDPADGAAGSAARAVPGAAVVGLVFMAVVLGLDSMGHIVPGPAQRDIARESHPAGHP